MEAKSHVNSGPRVSSVATLSVVIPTTGNRQQLLRRAVESCLRLALEAETEVIVVYNGLGKEAAPDEFDQDPRLRTIWIDAMNANAARNAGLAAANGELVRFLDDDDYLESSAASAQVEFASGCGADICTGGVRVVDANQCEFARFFPGTSEDFATEIFTERHFTLSLAHVYRREFLLGVKWNENRSYLQDVEWMHEILRRSEVRWVPFRRVVGAWCHHSGERISNGSSRGSRDEGLAMAAAIIESSIDVLKARERLTANRRTGAAKALWDYAHQGFQYSPVSWHRIARRARALDPQSRPGPRYLNAWPLSLVNPLILEWVFYPLRVMVRKITG